MRSMPTASRSAISGGMSCIVEQLGLAMIPSCQSRSSGLTCDTTSGTSGSMRQALELSITVQPRFAASGASSFEVPPPALKSAMSTPSNASGVARLHDDVPAVDRDGLPRRARRREEAQLRVRELLLEEDLDHRPADGAGCADDGDDERFRAGFGHGPTC